LNLHRTEGEIVPDDMTATTAARPLHGISVAQNNEMTVADVVRAQRNNTIANMSSRLGEAAAENPDAVAVSPAALDLANPQAAEPPAVSAARKGSSALDMPPATVGPLSLRLAAANGDPSAEFEVGARLAEGKGTDQNFKDAAKWYQRSADQGFAQAQYRLGTLYERGLGVKADEARAKAWYERAAEQGNIKAMHNLAVLSANSKAGAPDYTTAAKWFSQAAERGLADSQFNLAVLHENGLGVDADMRQAYKWLSLAARSGDKEATRRRDIMKGKLQANELAEAEAMVRTFKARSTDALVNDARTAGEAWKRNPANGENG
jgi:localization factor PodJL